MRTLYLVRHGENLANITKEFSCKEVDYPLTSKGRLQAKQTADFFVNLQINSVYSSPLKRAKETAEIIAQNINLPVQIKESFREIDVGSLEGQLVTKELWKEHNEILLAWKEGDHSRSFPNGENYIELLARKRKGIERIRQETDKNDNVILVGHGGIFAATAKDLISEEGFTLRETQNCSITKLHEAGDFFQVEYWSFIDHLSGEAAELNSGILKTE
jgi:broad specificity phosphatase PhoE